MCLCPLTEGNLGDGIADLSPLRRLGGRMCFGTDSNARISMPEEIRWLEMVQRLHQERRGVFRDQDGSVALPLFTAATRGGAQALGVDAGRLTPDGWADFFTLDLAAPALAAVAREHLLEAFIFGADSGAIREAWVGGARVCGAERIL